MNLVSILCRRYGFTAESICDDPRLLQTSDFSTGFASGHSNIQVQCPVFLWIWLQCLMIVLMILHHILIEAED